MSSAYAKAKAKDDRRRGPRTRIEAQLAVTRVPGGQGNDSEARALDISPTGMALAAEAGDLAVGDLLELRGEVAGTALACVARVVRIAQHPGHVGVEFLEFIDEMTSLVGALAVAD